MTARQLAFSLAYRPALGREDFLVSPSNGDAVAWIDQWPRWPHSVLLVHGPAACGKSHLAAAWRERSGAAPVGRDATDPGTVADLLARGQHWVFEDVDRWLACTAGGERFLLHLYNMLRDADGTLMLTARHPVRDWTLQLPDLASRLATVPAVPIRPPDEALLGGLLVKQFADRQLDVGQDVIGYLLARIERNFEGVRLAVERIDTFALERHRRITVHLIRELFASDGDRRTENTK